MPLGANVPRRRPAADASSLILPPRTFAPAFRLSPRPTSARQERRAEPAKRIPPDVQTLRDRPEFPCGGNAFGGSALRCCDCWMTGAARLFRKPAIRRPARPAGLRGEIKGEASAEGRRRRTFAPKACRSRRARQVATRPVIKHRIWSRKSAKEQKKPRNRGAFSSEERRAGKEWVRTCRTRWSSSHYKKKKKIKNNKIKNTK